MTKTFAIPTLAADHFKLFTKTAGVSFVFADEKSLHHSSHDKKNLVIVFDDNRLRLMREIKKYLISIIFECRKNFDA